MTVPLDLGLCTWMGMSFSLAAKDALDGMGEEPLLASKPYLAGLAFSTAVGTGIAAWCYREAPDWMLMYYADHEDIPPAVQVGMFGIYPLMYTFGFLFAHQLEKKRRGLGWAAWAGNFAFSLTYILVSMKRLLVVGTTEEYKRGEARSIFKTPLAPVLSVGLPGAFPALYYCARKAAGR